VDDHGEWLGSCELTPAYRLSGLCAFVDDFSIHQELDKSAPPRGWRAVFDDARLAQIAELKLFSLDPQALLPQLLDLFSGQLEVSPDLPHTRSLYDPSGHLVAVVAPYAEERERVCEVVTRPFLRTERRDHLHDILSRASSLGFVGATQGSVHVHYDGLAWKDSRTLCHWILAWHDQGQELLEELQPNPVTPEWRGSFPDAVVEVARAGQCLPFQELALQLARAGVRKRCDFNLLGIIRPRHRQMALEARVFPVLLDADALLERVAMLESFLAGVLRAGRRGSVSFGETGWLAARGDQEKGIMQDADRRTRDARRDPVRIKLLKPGLAELAIADPDDRLAKALACYCRDSTTRGLAVYAKKRDLGTLPDEVQTCRCDLKVPRKIPNHAK
jgi:hypothetical protein